jgi:hypothetical protein
MDSTPDVLRHGGDCGVQGSKHARLWSLIVSGIVACCAHLQARRAMTPHRRKDMPLDPLWGKGDL